MTTNYTKFQLFLSSNNFVGFSFVGISVNDKNKKKPIGMTSWKNINADNYKNFIKRGDDGFAVLTGKLSNITVIDIDNYETYTSSMKEYPEIVDYYTVRTNKGVHLYFSYDENVKTTTNIYENSILPPYKIRSK